ncbi:MAG: hypothetical protein NZM28_07880 [Fimbriimonadales bacterium]|nr:hypothetical protein [Fimbriimonadales bacterium]
MGCLWLILELAFWIGLAFVFDREERERRREQYYLKRMRRKPRRKRAT